ncbi:MAG: flagellar hook-associated protein FlgK [Armatimonadetes bacterium]|nr:flagellar hook-associated protein FlgK [Armatimonadota bacterium]
MPWTFFGLELASRALQSMQLAMNTTSHNLANVNTPGYSRQRVHLAATDPLALQGVRTLFLGSGVRVESIQRLRDLLLDARMASTSSDYHRYTTLYQRLTQVEDVFSEPTEAGLSRRIVAFFNAFQELSANPENVGIRAGVLQQSEAMTRTFRELAARLDEMFLEMEQRVRTTANEVNFLAQSIAELNVRIRYQKALGTESGDLLDQRTALVEKLSEYVGVRATEMADGTLRISLGEFVLVEGDRTRALPSDSIDYNGKALVNITGARAPVSSGSMRALMDAMQYIRAYRDRLDRLAEELVTQVNTLHQAGYGLDGSTNKRLLEGTNALNIRVSGDINDLNHIAAGVTSAPGDGNNALALSRLRARTLPSLDNKTLPDFYSAIVAELGEHTRSASIGRDNSKILLQNLQAERESVSGVNVDEEMSNLLRYQRSYQAAAQLVSMMDSAIADLIAALSGRR